MKHNLNIKFDPTLYVVCLRTLICSLEIEWQIRNTTPCVF